MFHKCDYADNRVKYRNRDGYCKHKGCYCDGNGYLSPDEVVEPIDKKDMCKKSSLFGNFYIGLTDEQIEALKNGAVFVSYGEYNFYIIHSEKESIGENA